MAHKTDLTLLCQMDFLGVTEIWTFIEIDIVQTENARKDIHKGQFHSIVSKHHLFHTYLEWRIREKSCETIYNLLMVKPTWLPSEFCVSLCQKPALSFLCSMKTFGSDLNAQNNWKTLLLDSRVASQFTLQPENQELNQTLL